MLITFLRHADRVKIACLAQLVNVIAPIMTENGGSAWAQTIFWPFLQASSHARGKALQTRVECPTCAAGKYGDMPAVEAITVENGKELTILAVNRSLEEDAELSLDLQGWGRLSLLEHSRLYSDDLKAVNTAAEPEKVRPEAGDGKTLLRHSWNLLRYRYED